MNKLVFEGKEFELVEIDNASSNKFLIHDNEGNFNNIGWWDAENPNLYTCYSIRIKDKFYGFKPIKEESREDKESIIREICTHHPSRGVEKGWSWYVGGMRDTGDWNVLKMLTVPISELSSFLDILREEERVRQEHNKEEDRIRSLPKEQRDKIYLEREKETINRILGRNKDNPAIYGALLEILNFKK